MPFLFFPRSASLRYPLYTLSGPIAQALFCLASFSLLGFSPPHGLFSPQTPLFYPRCTSCASRCLSMVRRSIPLVAVRSTEIAFLLSPHTFIFILIYLLSLPLLDPPSSISFFTLQCSFSPLVRRNGARYTGFPFSFSSPPVLVSSAYLSSSRGLVLEVRPRITGVIVPFSFIVLLHSPIICVPSFHVVWLLFSSYPMA